MSACIVPLVSIFLPRTFKNEKTSQSSFTRMPPSQWWFSFIPCLSVCSSPALSASYILPPGFRRHLRRSLKIWLLEKAHRLRTRWETSMSTVLGPFAAWYRISLFYFFLCVMFLFVYLLAETVKQTRHDFFLPICTLFALVWWQIEQYVIFSIPRDYWGNAFLLQHSLSLFSFSFSVCISQLPSHRNCIFPY